MTKPLSVLVVNVYIYFWDYWWESGFQHLKYCSVGGNCSSFMKIEVTFQSPQFWLYSSYLVTRGKKYNCYRLYVVCPFWLSAEKLVSSYLCCVFPLQCTCLLCKLIHLEQEFLLLEPVRDQKHRCQSSSELVSVSYRQQDFLSESNFKNLKRLFLHVFFSPFRPISKVAFSGMIPKVSAQSPTPCHVYLEIYFESFGSLKHHLPQTFF